MRPRLPLRSRSPLALRASAGVILALAACNGGTMTNCGGGCVQGGLRQIPAPGFTSSARIDRAAQARLTQTGMRFIETKFQDLVRAYGRPDRGQPTSVPCTPNFHTIP